MINISRSDLKRCYFISDTHFGVKNNNVDFFENSIGYMNDVFLKYIKDNYQDGDFVIHCGDVFDSRQSINIRVLNGVIDFFSKLSKVLPVFIICGNHDIYNKSSNKINSLKPLSLLNNVFIFDEEDAILNVFSNYKILLMPWKDGVNKELDVLSNVDADFACMHTTFFGTNFNRFVKLNDDIHKKTFLNLNDISKFKIVFSGHIHHRQHIENLVYLGCPYHINRNDINNDKGFYVYDFKELNLNFIKNDYSPKYIKLKLKNILDLTLNELNNITNNNYVDLVLETDDVEIFNYGLFTNNVLQNINYKSFNFQTDFLNDKIDDFNVDYDLDFNNFDLYNHFNNYIEYIKKSYDLSEIECKKMIRFFNLLKNKNSNNINLL